MRRMMNSVIFSAFLAGAAWRRPARPPPLPPSDDGNWSVLIITEKGECDRGYRYEVKVANGQVSYTRRHLGIDLAGTVAPDGAVKVSIKARRQGRQRHRPSVGPHRRRRLARDRRERQLAPAAGKRSCE